MTRYVVGLGSGILRFCVNPAVAGEWALSAIGLALSQVPWVSHLGHPTLAAAHARPAVFWAYATVHSVFSCARRHRASRPVRPIGLLCGCGRLLVALVESGFEEGVQS